MRIYTIHLGPVPEEGEDGGAVPAARDLVLVKEGFSWPAFLFTVLWALYHRLWLTAAALLVAGAALSGALEAWSPDDAVSAAVGLGYLLAIGNFANDWRRRELWQRGYEEAGVVAARRLDAAEHRVIEKLGPRLKVSA